MATTANIHPGFSAKADRPSIRQHCLMSQWPAGQAPTCKKQQVKREKLRKLIWAFCASDPIQIRLSFVISKHVKQTQQSQTVQLHYRAARQQDKT